MSGRFFTENPGRRLVPGMFDGGVGSLADRCGIVTCPAFLGVVDDLLQPAPCLCCCRAPTRDAARRASEQFTQVVSYFSQDSYTAAGSHRRVSERLSGRADTSAFYEFPKPQIHTPGRKATPHEVGLEKIAVRMCRAKGVTVYPVSHGWQVSREMGEVGKAGLALVVVSNMAARKLVRRLAAECKKRGLVLATRVASDAEMFVLRFKWKSMLVDVYTTGPDSVPALARLGEAAKGAVKTFERARRKGNNSRAPPSNPAPPNKQPSNPAPPPKQPSNNGQKNDGAGRGPRDPGRTGPGGAQRTGVP